MTDSIVFRVLAPKLPHDVTLVEIDGEPVTGAVVKRDGDEWEIAIPRENEGRPVRIVVTPRCGPGW